MLRCPMCDNPIDLTKVLPIIEIDIKKQYKGTEEKAIEKIEVSMCPDCCGWWLAIAEGGETLFTIKKWLKSLIKCRKQRNNRIKNMTYAIKQTKKYPISSSPVNS